MIAYNDLHLIDISYIYSSIHVHVHVLYVLCYDVHVAHLIKELIMVVWLR